MINDQDDQSLTPSHLERVVAVCDAFDAAWRDGQDPGIEDYLRGQPGAMRPALLRELLAIELELRVRFGEALVLQDYLDRFPDDAELVHSIFAATRLLAGSTKSDMATHCIPGAQPAGGPSAEAPSERDREASEGAAPPLGTERLDESSAR